MGKNYVFAEDLSPQDIEADVASQTLRLRREAGTTPVRGVDQLLIRQNGELFEVPATAVSSQFSFDKLTGMATVTAPDGTVSDQWQCTLLKDTTTSQVLGWVWPTPLQADLPVPGVNVTDLTSGAVTGRAYSVPIANFWDVPVTNLAGIVTHYAASAVLPDANYVSISSLDGTSQYSILTPA